MEFYSDNRILTICKFLLLLYAIKPSLYVMNVIEKGF